MSLLKKNTKKEFVLFDLNKDGRGIGKDEEALSGPPYNLKRGFKLFLTKFWSLISLNLIIPKQNLNGGLKQILRL